MSAGSPSAPTANPSTARPRIGFLGVGWIGRRRLRSLTASGLAEVIAVADLDRQARALTAADVPGAEMAADLDGLLDLEPDGIVIATPSAGHAEQAIAALDRGAAVFCEKPLARDAVETERVLEAARRADRLLAVDLSYRHTDAARAVRDVVSGGALGSIYAADVVFHNAYGPDKPWFTRRDLAGGGCLIDLGTHLVDLVLWLTASRRAEASVARLRRRGRLLETDSDEVEDFALAELDTDTGVVVRLACSWFLHAGRDCVFECTLYGTEGAVTMRNLDGSFYDFVAERCHGTACTALSAPGEDWGGRAIADWAARLRDGHRFDPAARELRGLAGALDHVYAVAR